MKKIFWLIVLVMVLVPNVIFAKEKVKVYVFSKEECPYCKAAIEYLEELHKDNEEVFEIVEYQVYNKSWKADSYYETLLNKVAEIKKDNVQGVPYIVIGKNYSLNQFQESDEEPIKKAILSSYEDENDEDIVLKAIDKIKNSSKYDTVIIVGIFVVLIGGIGTFLILSRKK